MSLAELLVVLTISLIVFGPSKLPMLARHLGVLLRKLNQVQARFNQLWQNKLKEIELIENEKRASEIDAQYQQTEKD